MSKGKYINLPFPICSKYSFAALIIGSTILFASTAHAWSAREDIIDIALVIFGIPTIIEIVTFVIHRFRRTNGSALVFFVISLIYIPIISILLGMCLTSFIMWLLHTGSASDDEVMLASYLLIVSSLYAIFIKNRDKL